MMLKYYTALLILLFSAGSLTAQHTALPQIPDRTLNVMTSGADNTGKQSSTAAIQNTLNKMAASGGGKVIIPTGLFLSGPLKLPSKVNLQLDKGAVLRLANDISTYPLEAGHYGNFIEAIDATDIRISGSGTIDGQGEIWWQAFDAKKLSNRRPQMVYLVNPTRVEISGVTFLNPPNTHLSIKDGTDVYIHNITMEAPEHSHNTDGINISARRCTIENSQISTGDDDIAFNFGRKKDGNGMPACGDILVRNCKFLAGHGLSIGSYTAGNLNGLMVRNCSFEGTTSAIRIKSAVGRGGMVENVSYADISISNSKSPIYISAYYPKEPASPELDTVLTPTAQMPNYRNITFKNIKITGADYALRLWGLPASPLKQFTFEGLSIAAKHAGVISNARDISFINCRIIAADGLPVNLFKSTVSGLK